MAGELQIAAVFVRQGVWGGGDWDGECLGRGRSKVMGVRRGKIAITSSFYNVKNRAIRSVFTSTPMRGIVVQAQGIAPQISILTYRGLCDRDRFPGWPHLFPPSPPRFLLRSLPVWARNGASGSPSPRGSAGRKALACGTLTSTLEGPLIPSPIRNVLATLDTHTVGSEMILRVWI